MGARPVCFANIRVLIIEPLLGINGYSELNK